MKIYAIIASLFLMVGCVHSSGKSSPVDINGTWKGEMKSGMGGPPMNFTFNFKKVADSIKGSVNGMPGQWIPLEDIEIKGKKITFTVTSDMGPTKMKIKYKGKIKGEKIKLNFKTEIPGASRGNKRNADLSMGGGFSGGMGGGFGMGAPTSLNEFTVERVSNETEGPIN